MSVDPFEHHSSLLWWRGSSTKVVIISENEDDGKVCIFTLGKELKVHAQQGQQKRMPKKLWGMSNSYLHDSSDSSTTISTSNGATIINSFRDRYSKRAAVKTWAKCVFVRSHSSSSAFHDRPHSQPGHDLSSTSCRFV